MVNKVLLKKSLTESLRLIKYDRSLTLLEQTDNTYVNQLNPELLTNTQTYPNYCSYPKQAVLPPEINGESGLIDGYCFYRVPTKTKGQTAGMFIPQDAKITFYSDLEQYDTMINKHMEKHPEDNLSVIEELIPEIFPLGTVAKFEFKGQKYYPWITRPDDVVPWRFKGFYRIDGTAYEQPKWEDKRNEYQKFVDEWGFALQITAALATAIAGAYTGGAAWTLTAEILLELGLGTAVALRELEKGQNVSAAVSFITGVLPMLKLSPAFKGLNSQALKSVSEKVEGAGLTKSSSFKDYLKFYRSLGDEEQKVMSQIFTQDEIARTKFLNEIKFAVDEALPKLVTQEITKNPQILRQLSFWDKLWARELSANGAVVIVGLATQLLFGKQLNDEEKQKLTQLYQYIPKEHSKEFFYNIAMNGNNVGKILNNIPTKDLNKLVNTSKVANNINKWYNSKLKSAVEKTGGEYTELPNDPSKSAEDIEASKQKVKKYRNEGWVPEKELNNREWYDIIFINNETWYKLTP
jgi:hypothetical protein